MTCRCKSRAGRRKKLWATEAAAQFVARLATTDDGLDHIVYECPDMPGKYHVATVRDTPTYSVPRPDDDADKTVTSGA